MSSVEPEHAQRRLLRPSPVAMLTWFVLFVAGTDLTETGIPIILTVLLAVAFWVVGRPGTGAGIAVGGAVAFVVEVARVYMSIE